MLNFDWHRRGTKDDLEKKIGKGFKCVEGWHVVEATQETTLVVSIGPQGRGGGEYFDVWCWNSENGHELIKKIVNLPLKVV